MRHRIGRAVGAAVLALGTLAPALAGADGTADEAEMHFRLGKEDFRQGKFESAILHFLQSNRLVKNRNVLFNVASAYEQLKAYADAYRYYVDAADGETDTRNLADIETGKARVLPQIAVLRVVTDPPGAALFVDRKDLGSKGISPKPLALAEGSYRIIAELPGYEPAAREGVEAARGKETVVELKLRRIVGKAHIEASVPSERGASAERAEGAVVRIDDERSDPACALPCDIDLPPGRHDLYFSAPGFDPATKPVLIVADKTTSVTGTLTPLMGSLLVETDEPGALVAIDGVPFGFTPVVAQGIRAGKRGVRVSLRGYAPVETEVMVEGNAQVKLPPIALQPLREVTAASRFTETIDDAPSSVSVIDRLELDAMGYPTIAEALRGTRGVVVSTDRAYASIGIRGLGQPNDYGNRVLVMSDGQPLNDNLLNSSYVGADGRVDLHDVERIEIVRGPGSLLYGTGAFSGVVNLVMRQRDLPTTAWVSGGVYDNVALRARAGGHVKLGKDAGIWGSVAAAHSPGLRQEIAYPSPNGTGTRVARVDGIEAFSSVGSVGRAYWKWASLQWLYHQREQKIPVGAYATLVNDPGTQFLDRRAMVELRIEPRLTDTVQLFGRAHANHYGFSSTYVYEDDKSSERFAGTWMGAELRLVWNPASWLRITAGGEGQYHPELRLLGTSDTGDKPYVDETNPYSFGAGYALVEGSPAKWFRFSAGARVDVYSTFGPIVVPRAAAIFRPAEGSQLKILAGRAFRAPSVYEQVYNDGGISEVRAVDPSRGLSLGAESVLSGEVEYSQRFLGDFTAILAGHTSYVEGLIGSVPDSPGSDLIRYANLAAPAWIAGGDIELRREWRRGILVAAMYGYQRAVTLDAALGDPRLVNVPEHLASARFVVPVVKEWVSLGGRVTLEAPRKIEDASPRTTPANVLVDLSLSGAFRTAGFQYVLAVYNLADRRIEVPVSDTFQTKSVPQNGRTLLVDLVWTAP